MIALISIIRFFIWRYIIILICRHMIKKVDIALSLNAFGRIQ